MGTVVNGNKWTGACVNGNIVSGLVKNGIVFYKKNIDTAPPTIITVAILNNTPADSETGYKYATNGDTIRVLATFDEELILNDNFVLTINNTTVKFSRSGDKVNSDGTPKYEYIAQYKIPEDESELAEGPITFEISGCSDLAGNTNSPITTANHPKYNSVEYYI